MTDFLTTPDRAERARAFWEGYRDRFGGDVSSLIADLMHLADVDEHADGGPDTVRRAVGCYAAAQPLWPAEERKAPKYLAQFRPEGQEWITVAEGDDAVEPEDVACCLWIHMLEAGMPTEAMPDLADDMARGVVLVARNGTAFRLFVNPDRA
ncbi:hypothetical protein [Streptomyces tsukubensis]|uniref:hypothetical protein n=1 Tax=Streptomyces tsukubensis TaxID=83656 RepID=UPI00344BD33E